MTVNVHVAGVQPDIANGISVDFTMSTLIDSVKGGTASIGARVLVHARVSMACELRIAYAADGPYGTPTFRDRGTVDKLVAFADYRAVVAAVGTNVRVRVTNISATPGAIEVFTVLL